MRLGFAVLLCLLVFAGSAHARTVQQDLAAAHAYWGTTVCAGQWQVTPDPSLPEHGLSALATGIAFRPNPLGTYVADGKRWDWFIASCTFSMDPGLQGCDREKVVIHEVGHFVHGPGHTGPLSDAALARVRCSTHPRPAHKRNRRCARRKGGAGRAFIHRHHRRGVSPCSPRSVRRGVTDASRRRPGVR